MLALRTITEIVFVVHVDEIISLRIHFLVSLVLVQCNALVNDMGSQEEELRAVFSAGSLYRELLCIGTLSRVFIRIHFPILHGA